MSGNAINFAERGTVSVAVPLAVAVDPKLWFLSARTRTGIPAAACAARRRGSWSAAAAGSSRKLLSRQRQPIFVTESACGGSFGSLVAISPSRLMRGGPRHTVGATAQRVAGDRACDHRRHGCAAPRIASRTSCDRLQRHTAATLRLVARRDGAPSGGWFAATAPRSFRGGD